MNLEEALAWLRGERSMINTVPSHPLETWQTRIGEADAALTQQAYWVAKAHNDGLVPLKPVARGDAKATFDLIAHLHRQIAWSSKTFGPHDRVKGCSDHIRKELDEIAANPSDISERIDVLILAFDLAWRGGFSPEEIVAAMVAKQTKNEARTWPDWRTADPEKAIEHDRGQPPVAAGSTGAA